MVDGPVIPTPPIYVPPPSKPFMHRAGWKPIAQAVVWLLWPFATVTTYMFMIPYMKAQNWYNAIVLPGSPDKE